MKIRPLATLLAIVALYGCDSGPTLAARQLSGSWIGERQSVDIPFPGGVHTDELRVHVTFTPDHRYQRQDVIFDPQLNREFVEYAIEGTFTTADGLLTLNIERLYTRAGGELTSAPVLQAFTGEGKFGYTLHDDVLTVNWCPGGVFCIRDRLTQHTRVQ